MRPALLVAASVVGACVVAPAWATAPHKVRLEYVRGDGAESCAEATALRRAVSARLGYDPFDPKAANSIRFTLTGKDKKFYAHDEKGEAKVGDTVRIQETRPMSKTKRWRLVEVVRSVKSAA